MVINILICVIVSIILQISDIYDLLGYEVPCIPGKGQDELNRINSLKTRFKFGLKIIQLPFLITAVVWVKSTYVLFQQVASEGCSDPTTNSDLYSIGDALYKDVF